MKTYKGYELIKEIAEGNIEDGTRFKDSCGNLYIKTNDVAYLEDEKGTSILDCFYSLDELALTNFELIEDNTIDNIEELNEEIAYTNLDYITKWNESEKRIVKQQNKILEAVKQLNKEIKELKER